MRDASGLLLVLQTPKQGRESDHLNWYISTHLPDVCAISGVVGGAFAAADGGGPASQWSNAALYWLHRDPTEFLTELFDRTAAGMMELSDTLDPEHMMMAIAEALTPRKVSEITRESPDLDRQYYLMLTNATYGQDEQFNAWYSDVHLEDVLKVPGFVAAQRFRLIDSPALKSYPYRYLAIYEIQGRPPEEALGDLNARAGAGQMIVSPALDTSALYASVFHVQGARAGSG